MTQIVSFSPIRNPANPERAFVYRIAPDVYTLGYDQRALRRGVAAPRWNKDPDETKVPSTLLQANSHIVTLKFDDVVHVYGVHQGSKIVSLMSPFVEPVTPEIKAPNGALAGCAFTENDEEQAWLVYQKVTIGENKDKKDTKIFYSDVTSPDAQDSPSTAKDIREGTALSLFHDTKRFWVIYQNCDGQLVAHNERDQKPSMISSDISHFLEGTPIASCFIPAKDIESRKVPGFRNGALGRVIVYWVRMFNKQPCLYRSHADLTEKSSIADFSEPRQATENGVAVQQFAQIGIVPDRKTQSNHVFVAKEGGDNISSVVDDWATKNEPSHGLDMANMELFKRWKAKIVEDALWGRYGKSKLMDDEMMARYRSRYLQMMEEEEEAEAEEEEEEKREALMGRGGRKPLPLVWRNKGETTRPQLHTGVIHRTASSRWSEADVQVIIPAGSAIMGDILVKLRVRPTD